MVLSKRRRQQLNSLKLAQEAIHRKQRLTAELKVKLEREVDEDEGKLSVPEDPLQVGVGDEDILCFLCCYSFTSPRDSSEETLQKFLRGSEFFPDASLTAQSLLRAGRGLSLCPECAGQVSLAVRRREKVAEVEAQVRELQLQLLRLMMRLQILVNSYMDPVEQLTDKVRCSDESCLRERLKEENRSTRQNISKFRREFISGTTKLQRFQGKISTKFASPDPVPATTRLSPEPPPLNATSSLEAEIKPEPLSDIEQDDVVPSPASPEAAASTEEEPPTLPPPKRKKVAKKIKLRPQMSTTRAALGKLKTRTGSALVPCPHCSTRVASLSRHLEKRCRWSPQWTAEHPWPYTCAQCGTRCKGSLSLQRHQNSSHPDSAPADTDEAKALKLKSRCESCGKMVAKSFRGNHFRYYCPGRPAEMRKQFVCEQCGAVLSTKSTLFTHRKEVHSPENRGSFPCDLCGKVFATKVRRRVHRKRHLENATRRWVCERCGGSFGAAGYLTRHKRICDGSKKPRAPRWTNMVRPVDISPETAASATCNSTEGQLPGTSGVNFPENVDGMHN